MSTLQVALALCALAYASLNAAAAVWNRVLALPPRAPFRDVRRLLVVAPHQDDEAIMAGGLMARTVSKKGEVRVVMMTDGATARDGTTQASVAERRGAETKSALRSIGVTESHVTFLNMPAEHGLRDPDTLRQAVRTLMLIMNEFRPDAVVTSAFEGGHPDHDATNYAVARAARDSGVSADIVYEACEYNGYFLSAGIMMRLNPFMIVRWLVPPRFVPGRNPPMTLDMSTAELRRKLVLLGNYKSQKPHVLIKLFGFPDQFRVMESHAYAQGPFNPASTLRYRVCRLLGGSSERCNPFNYGISIDGYASLYGTVEADMNAA